MKRDFSRFQCCCTRFLERRGQSSLADVLDEVFRVALVRMVDDELAEKQSGSVRTVRSKHRVVDDVVSGADVAATAWVGARRPAKLARLTRHVGVSKDHPHDVHVQRLPSSHATVN